MATGRVFQSCRIILILLLFLSSVLGNRPCKHSCRGNKTLCSQLNAADAKDGLDIFGFPLQDVINASEIGEIGGHIGFEKKVSQVENMFVWRYIQLCYIPVDEGIFGEKNFTVRRRAYSSRTCEKSMFCVYKACCKNAQGSRM